MDREAWWATVDGVAKELDMTDWLPKQWIKNQSPGRSVVKNLPANAGDSGDMDLTPVQEDPLEDEMATHCSVLAWKNPVDKETWWATYSPQGHKRVIHDLVTQK